MTSDQTGIHPAVETTVTGIHQRVGQWRQQGAKVALVPTMGALHAGHLALVGAANKIADRTIVSIFVNPTQFTGDEDYPFYPRELDRDIRQLDELADAVFCPGREEMYPDGFATTVAVASPAEGLESDFRPHFFPGVATIVAKLLIVVQPNVVVFGEKDFQQLLVVRRLVTDLRLPVEVASHTTIREPDGLALSSRNRQLNTSQRRTAPMLFQSISAAASAIRAGKPVSAALKQASEALTSGGFDVDYVELRDAATLAPAGQFSHHPLRLLAAVRLGRVRLIDNVPV